jgi:predicted TIM-barrel fold metal-dependent hydrolase
VPTLFDQGRRAVLRGLSANAALGLAGCCCRGFPAQQITAAAPAANTINPILRPLRVSAAGKPAPYCLDAHTHFFNGSDINAKGYFEGGVVRSVKPQELQDFARLLGPLLDELTEAAPTAQEEFDLLRQRATASALVSAEGVHPLQDIADAQRQKIAALLAKRMKDNKLDQEFLRLRRMHATRLGVTLPAKDISDFSEETILDSIDHKRRMQRHRALFGTPNRPAQGGDPGGYLEFVGYMLSYRFMNLRTYQEQYTEADGVPGIDGVFNALVDFDYWLDCPTESQREDQVRVQSLLALLSGGYMLPLVAYNPWTDIERDGASLDLVQRAITQYGFVGVKIYPSNGFFPYGNSDPTQQVQTGQRRPDLTELDARLLAMFTWCAENGVPVMAHADESMGADSAADGFGGPRGWQALLDKMKMQGLPPPAINIGHFGGDVPEPDHPDNDWPVQFAGLFGMPEGKNVYADLGYWTALCTCGTWPADRPTVLARLQAALAMAGAGERIMYGTDWFMISTEQDWATYSRDLVTNLSAFSGQLPMDRLFYRNVIACFGLGTGGGQRERVLAYYSGVPGGVPKWLAEA